VARFGNPLMEPRCRALDRRRRSDTDRVEAFRARVREEGALDCVAVFQKSRLV
jgi:hypothetical protein